MTDKTEGQRQFERWMEAHKEFSDHVRDLGNAVADLSNSVANLALRVLKEGGK